MSERMRTVAGNALVAAGVFFAVTCASTFVGIAFESGSDRLALIGIAPSAGILATLSLLASHRLLRPDAPVATLRWLFIRCFALLAFMGVALYSLYAVAFF